MTNITGLDDPSGSSSFPLSSLDIKDFSKISIHLVFLSSGTSTFASVAFLAVSFYDQYLSMILSYKRSVYTTYTSNSVPSPLHLHFQIIRSLFLHSRFFQH